MTQPNDRIDMDYGAVEAAAQALYQQSRELRSAWKLQKPTIERFKPIFPGDDMTEAFTQNYDAFAHDLEFEASIMDDNLDFLRHDALDAIQQYRAADAAAAASFPR